MKIIKTKKTEIKFIKAAFIACACMILFTPFIGDYFGLANSFSKVYLDGNYIGCVNDPSKVETMLLEARLQLAKEQKEMVLADVRCTYEPMDTWFGTAMQDEELYEKLYDYLKNDTVDIQRAYMVKINTYTVYLNTIEDVYTVLESAKEKYDPENQFQVNIIADTEREINMYTAELISTDVKLQDVETVSAKLKDLKLYENAFTIEDIPDDISEDIPNDLPEEEQQQPAEEPEQEPETDQPAEEPEQEPEADQPVEEPAEEPEADGLKEMSFSEKVEIAEAYVSKSLISPVEDAVEQVTKDQAKNEVYEVKAGDTLSVIANSHDLMVKDVLALNEGLDENTMLHIGDEIIITVPQPELTVKTVEQSTYEEPYFAEVEYIYNDNWFTTESVVRQEAVAGYHQISAMITRVNGTEESREIIDEVVLQEPVQQIIEVGTQTPPTFIKPISGGRLTSRYGRRKSPTKGASSNHKGIDWGTPVGTAVMASSGGTVTVAGWQSGYGYVVYISHPDGKQTRYGHLSKVLVSVGQKVTQGQKIALSGNTGRSTGPHLHFEIRVNGVAVNPFDYI
ncbi:MAG: peptidoglycan DD-metalloendopeptidase family protein [Lachnospiraceae bacterium]